MLPQRVLPLPDLLLIEGLVAAGLTVALLSGTRGWYGALGGVALAMPLVVRFRGSTLPRRAARWLAFTSERRRRRGTAAIPVPFDATMPDGSPIGFRWDGTVLVSLIRIHGNPQALTVLEPGATVSGDSVPIQLLADCLHQFDIEVDSIDIISQGARSQGRGPVAAMYDAMVGPLPAIAHRNLWVTLRFDPQACAEAITHRGGGHDGIVRAATAATRRVANRLAGAGLRPEIATATQIAHATGALCDGVALTSIAETWQDCHEGDFTLRTYAIDPTILTSAGLGMQWTIPSYSTTLCISLRNAGAQVQVRALVRVDGRRRADRPRVGHVALPGRQYMSLLASLPVPQRYRSIGTWATGSTEALAGLTVPVSGCGQLIGADDRGRAVALTLFGAQLERVEICGTLHLGQQVVLRALALGARVRVHTRRPGAWHPMVAEVADPGMLRVTDLGRPALKAGAERNYSVEMFDGVAEQPVRAGVTAMVLKPRNAVASPDADVALELLDSADDVVRVRTRAGYAVVKMVATDDEMRYLRASFEAKE
ncbi:type VII secretion protein EccE [Mycobacterium sp. CBMA226]|nr:type VII secretion protein EccE [Mycolicibacterium sp. CBMA 226]